MLPFLTFGPPNSRLSRAYITSTLPSLTYIIYFPFFSAWSLISRTSSAQFPHGMQISQKIDLIIYELRGIFWFVISIRYRTIAACTARFVIIDLVPVLFFDWFFCLLLLYNEMFFFICFYLSRVPCSAYLGAFDWRKCRFYCFPSLQQLKVGCFFYFW